MLQSILNTTTGTAATQTPPTVATGPKIMIYVGAGAGAFALIVAILISLLFFILSAQRRRKKVKTQLLAKVNNKNLPFEVGNAGEVEMMEGFVQIFFSMNENF